MVSATCLLHRWKESFTSKLPHARFFSLFLWSKGPECLPTVKHLTYLASGSDVAGSRLFFASSDFVLLASGSLIA